MTAPPMPPVSYLPSMNGKKPVPYSIQKRIQCQQLEQSLWQDRSSFDAHWKDLSNFILPAGAVHDLRDQQGRQAQPEHHRFNGHGSRWHAVGWLTLRCHEPRSSVVPAFDRRSRSERAG